MQANNVANRCLTDYIELEAKLKRAGPDMVNLGCNQLPVPEHKISG